MFIQTEATPNPATLKFIPGVDVMGSGTANFESADKAGRSPLAAALFEVEGISGVFLGSDFISVTSTGDKEWDLLKPQVLGTIMDHFSSDKPVIAQEEAAGDDTDDDGIVMQIKELLETRVRPLWPRTAAILSSMVLKTASFICTCKALAPAVQAPPQPLNTALKTC